VFEVNPTQGSRKFQQPENSLFQEDIIMAIDGIQLNFKTGALLLLPVLLLACAASNIPSNYHDPEMDFSALRTIGVMPFANLTNDKLAAERVRNSFMTSLLATGVVYVTPAGEIARGISRLGLVNPATPSPEEAARIAAIVKADAMITGVVTEYGDVRSGSTAAHVISFNVQMIERETQRAVWTATTTKGGISVWDRLFGGGGRPMHDVTEAAINDIINKLFY